MSAGVEERTTRGPRRGLPTRVVLAAVLLVSLLVAGGVSLLASGSPDGLNRVAQDEGFSSTEKEHASSDSPFAGYETRDVEGGRSTAIAGVTGALTVLLLAGGLTWAVRRRGPQVGDQRDQRDQRGA